MTDADLARKFHGLADPILGLERTKHLLNLCWRIGEADSVSAIAEAACL
jgi:hypothetical protein